MLGATSSRSTATPSSRLADDPGPCPGEGWHCFDASAANPGLEAERGERGERGPAAPRIVDWQLELDGYRAIPILSDGTRGAPLPVLPFFDQYHAEVRGAA